MRFLRTTKKTVSETLLLALVMLVLSVSKTLAEDSKLAGAWTLVKGKRQFTVQEKRHEIQLPSWEEGRAYLVINPDGSFDTIPGSSLQQLDRIRNKADSLEEPLVSSYSIEV